MTDVSRRLFLAGAGAAELPLPAFAQRRGSDDMLIVKGINVFPSAVRDVVTSFEPSTPASRQLSSGFSHRPPP